MEFKAWLLSRKAQDNPRGDFLRDVRRDRTFPIGRTWDEVHGYMWQRGACLEAREEAERLWKQFRKIDKRRPLYSG